MKKLLLLSFVLAAATGIAFGGITVTSPSGGTWYKGTSPHTISWTSSGCTGPNVKINIFKGSINPANFVEQLTATLASGSKSWVIPGSYTTGTYYIRIKSSDPAETSCLGDSPAFQIAESGGGAASITLIKPIASTEWCKGGSGLITWTSSGSPDPNVKINIFKGSIDPANFVTQLTATTASGSKSWAIPASTVAGTYYIRVKTNDNALQTDSPGFLIKDCGTPGAGCSPFVVYEPQKNSLHFIGFNLSIKWKNKIIALPGILEAQRTVKQKLTEPVRGMSKIKLVKIEIKSVKCISTAPYLPRIKEAYLQKKVPMATIDKLLKSPWLVELLNWKTIAAAAPDNGSFTWNVPGTYKKGCYVIRVTKLWCDAGDPDRVATSDSFTLIPESVTLEVL